MTTLFKMPCAVVLSVAAAIAPVREVAGQSSVVFEKLSPLIEGSDFRRLETPSATIKLGGWVVPGHEREGSALDDATLSALQPHTTRDSVVEVASTPVKSVESLIATADAFTLRAFAWAKPCFSSPVSFSAFRFHILSSKARRNANAPDLIDWVSKKVGADREAFDGAVVVWAVVTADVAITGCANKDVQDKLASRMRDVVWAYKAGAPTAQQSATGDNPFVAILHAFDLNSLARDRTVRVKSIEVKPSGGVLSYISRLQAAGRNPASLSDEELQQLGPSPTGPQDLWAGRFYFRIKRGNSPVMTVRDLTLADRDKPLVLQANPAGRP